ncbi:MAG: Dam family site-specific DNA-(adenine-N6)-methyltransferase, partial [Anaerolinea sp.]|nr:Dam family site-specific DNA-(adenine-N6)-methyltransferase [Anaerolinea sp.]
MYAAETAFQARPVLKWAGGKARLLPELLRRIPGRFAGYHEPLMGGGALFFTLASAQVFSRATLSDINPHLMDVYLALRDDVEGVIAALRQHQYSEDHYYQVRALRPEDLTLTARAARIIFLNKTCYNGLYRENRAGQFNVPFGRYRNPTICDENNLRAASLVLQGVDIGVRPFTTILDLAHPGDFVYFDPPYHPVSTTARFTQYSKHGFT